MRTDTERLDWVLENLIGEPKDAALNALLGALALGKTGREAVDIAMNGEVPEVVGQIARVFAEKYQ